MSILLPVQFRERRGAFFSRLVEQDILDSWPRYQKVREYRALYYGTATSDMPLPWEGASNIHLPVMMEKVETFVPMVMSAFWGVDPVVNVRRSPEEYNSEQTDDVEQFMNFVLMKDIPEFYDTFETWVRNTGIDSMGYLHPWWNRSTRNVSMLHHLKKLYDTGDKMANEEEAIEAREKTATELLVEIFGPIGEPLTSRSCLLGAWILEGEDTGDPLFTTWAVEFIEERLRYHATVKFVPARHIDEITAQVRRRVLERDGVEIDCVEFEDLILPYRSKSIKTADRVTQRYWLTVDEVERLWHSGEWDMDEKDMEILRGQSTRQYDAKHFDPQLQRQLDQILGERDTYRTESAENRRDVRVPESFGPYNKNKVQIFKVFVRDTVEEGEEPTEVIYHIPYALRKVVQADYLDEKFPHGMRPFIVSKYLPVSNRWAAIGLGDQLAAINMEVNTLINQINNAQALLTNPFFFYEPTALSGDKVPLQGIKPGQGIPVMSVQGVLFPTFNQQPLANVEVMTSVLMFADRLTISPMNSGSTQMKNAPRTARGTLAMLGEGHVKTDMLITRMQSGPWTELMEQVYGLYQEFMCDEKWHYITRKDGSVRPNRMSKLMMRGRYEFVFKGNTTNTNREVLRTMAQVRYNTLMTNPDSSTDPHVRKNITMDFLKYWGDGADADRLVPALPGEGAFQHPPMTQQDECKAIAMGMNVPILPTDAHAEHLQVMDTLEKQDQFALMPQYAVGLWASHKMAHMQALRAQVANSTLPTSPGMGNNVPEGMTLAGGGNDMGVMEGGNMR